MVTKSRQELSGRTRVVPISLRGLSLRETVVGWLFLGLVLAQGAFLRLWQINALGFNTDEAVYAGQAAAIVQDPALAPYFPLFRAHPLLFQFIMALAFAFGVSDLAARLAAVVVGLAAVLLTYRIGSILYGQAGGLLAALFLSLMPYHVVVSRQALLDGAMTTCATLTLYAVARWAQTEHRGWLYAAGAGLGLTFLAKETGIVLAGAIFGFLLITPELRVRLRDLAVALLSMVLVISPFPISMALAGRTSTGQQYLVWQLFRRPNHEWDFYLTTVPPAMGVVVILLAVVGLWLYRRPTTWREKLLVAWIFFPLLFFQLWPVKGFQYLLPIAPAVTVLAARTLARSSSQEQVALGRWSINPLWVKVFAITSLSFLLLLSSWLRVQASISDQFLAGSGGVPGGREAGRWIDENLPEGARMMALGPSMANILQFYGHRRVYGLSVSPNPLRRNPSYDAILNPDLQLRNGDIQYIVWDSFSATRSHFFEDALLQYVKRYHGRVVHTESITVTSPEGAAVARPVIIIYEVRP